ncbi:MAG: glycoside hydrolase family 88 protein [Marinifilaceae bacterium]
MRKLQLFTIIIVLFAETVSAQKYFKKNVELAAVQTQQMLEIAQKDGKPIIPRTTGKAGETRFTGAQDWTSGFFAGSLWHLYQLTGSEQWKQEAERHTAILESVQNLKWHHDIGFMIGCSYGNGYNITNNPQYKPIIIQSAKSLCTRFRPGAGIIQSWNVTGGWQSQRGWSCPVIIDNMMNLELLFEATRLSGDSTFYKVAVSHADATLKNQYRQDNSCYHVVDYNPENGQIRHKHTAQGYAHESAWARGQAWGIYGFTMCYRYTKNKQYLEQAEKIAEYLFSHPRMPKDLVPYWDFDAPDIPQAPRDASAAAIIASALYELDGYSKKNYRKTADKIVKSLSSPAYFANTGENGKFILKHSVGSIPHNQEIDVPLVYADYYYLEALVRKNAK